MTCHVNMCSHAFRLGIINWRNINHVIRIVNLVDVCTDCISLPLLKCDKFNCYMVFNDFIESYYLR